MAPEDLTEFFLASAGTGGAFVGSLFVAISIGTRRTFGDPSVDGAPRQRLAEGTFLTLVNGFVVSSIALIPGGMVGWVALVLGVAGGLIAGHLAWLLARFHRHRPAPRTPWRHLLRVVSLSVVATVVGAIEGLLGLRLIMRPTDAEAWRGLALVIVGLYSLGILRAWVLLGNPQHQWSGWLNPLQDFMTTGDVASPREASIPNTVPRAIRRRPDKVSTLRRQRHR